MYMFIAINVYGCKWKNLFVTELYRHIENKLTKTKRTRTNPALKTCLRDGVGGDVYMFIQLLPTNDVHAHWNPVYGWLTLTKQYYCASNFYDGSNYN